MLTAEEREIVERTRRHHPQGRLTFAHPEPYEMIRALLAILDRIAPLAAEYEADLPDAPKEEKP